MITEAERLARQEKTKKQILWVGAIAFLLSCVVVFFGVYASSKIHETDNLKTRAAAFQAASGAASPEATPTLPAPAADAAPAPSTTAP